MRVDLLSKEISDIFVRENFSRLKRLFEQLQILDGNWNFYDIEITAAGSAHPVKHGLDFIPRDIILLSVSGNQGVFFDYHLFNEINIYITTQGPARIRCLVGLFNSYSNSNKQYPYAAAAGSSLPSPGSENQVLAVQSGVWAAATLEDILAFPRTDFTELIDTVGSDTYVGFAVPGTATSAANWKIKKVTDLGGDDYSIKWADGTDALTKVWDDRLTYTYS